MAATLSGTYDFSQSVIIVDGIILSNFSDGDCVIVRASEDYYTTRVGTDGGVARARNSNRMGEFEFRLLQTSGSNDFLSALININDLANGGNKSFAISVTDLSGRSGAVATQCWIKTIPEMILGQEISERVWVFTAADLRMFHGGN